MRAADKYEMESATEVLLLLLRTACMQMDTLHLYGLAGRYGQEDIVDDALKRLLEMRIDIATAAHIDGAQMGRLVSKRQQRVERFCRLLGQTNVQGPFHHEHGGRCPLCRSTASHAVQNKWLSLVITLQSAFVAHPSDAALEEDERAKALISELGTKVCRSESCGRALYDWPNIRARLQAL